LASAASTIGFGDIAENRLRLAYLLHIFFIPLSVAVAGELISGVALAISRRRQKGLREATRK
jgi:hypothetical protein